MRTFLLTQLKEQRILHKIDDVMHEVARARQDFGYPLLATPSSNIVAAHAAFNVICGERYKVVPKETRALVRGPTVGHRRNQR